MERAYRNRARGDLRSSRERRSERHFDILARALDFPRADFAGASSLFL
jgi:hypothetical protein